MRALETEAMPPKTITLFKWEGNPERSDTLEAACSRNGISPDYPNLEIIQINIMKPVGGGETPQ
jgi:hypothetical protein